MDLFFLILYLVSCCGIEKTVFKLSDLTLGLNLNTTNYIREWRLPTSLSVRSIIIDYLLFSYGLLL